MSEGEPGSPRANNSSSAMSQDGFPKGKSLINYYSICSYATNIEVIVNKGSELFFPNR